MVNQKSFRKHSKFLNSRGQAFSVFELMIAAIVAIAILAVLMSVLGGGMFNPTSNPVDSISNALSAATPSGEARAQAFALESRSTVISSIDIAQKANLDRRSVVLFSGEISDRLNCDVRISSSTSEPYSVCQYNRATASNSEARVYCSITGDDLTDKLDIALGSNIDWSPSDIDQICEAETYQPCCAVVFMR
jgi:hypothetical protein